MIDSITEVEEVVVDEGLSRFGLFSLHVMRIGMRVDRERWLEEKVWNTGAELMGWLEYEDEGIGVWHLRLWWKHRDTEKG
jgi:hypothetical protein